MNKDLVIPSIQCTVEFPGLTYLISNVNFNPIFAGIGQDFVRSG